MRSNHIVEEWLYNTLMRDAFPLCGQIAERLGGAHGCSLCAWHSGPHQIGPCGGGLPSSSSSDASDETEVAVLSDPPEVRVWKIVAFEATARAIEGRLEHVGVRLQLNDGRTTKLEDPAPLLNDPVGRSMLHAFSREHPAFAKYMPEDAVDDEDDEEQPLQMVDARSALWPLAQPWAHALGTKKRVAVRCTQCSKWRLVHDSARLTDDWECSHNLDPRFDSCEFAQEMDDASIDRYLGIKPGSADPKEPRRTSEDTRERLGLPDEACFSMRSTFEKRVAEHGAEGQNDGGQRLEDLQQKLPEDMREAGWFVVPAGGEAAYNGGHYAYMLPDIGEDEIYLPYFRNIDEAKLCFEKQQKKSKKRKPAKSAEAKRPPTTKPGEVAAKRPKVDDEPQKVPQTPNSETWNAMDEPEVADETRPLNLRRIASDMHPPPRRAALVAEVQLKVQSEQPLRLGRSCGPTREKTKGLRIWVQCEDPSCGKWRVVSSDEDVNGWTCERQAPYSHDAPEETMDEDEEMVDEPTEDEQLPGWLVSTHMTSGGRLYKSFTSPSGQIYRSRVTALAACLAAQSSSTQPSNGEGGEGGGNEGDNADGGFTRLGSGAQAVIFGQSYPGRVQAPKHKSALTRIWVQCEDPSCGKWRVVSSDEDVNGWTCERQAPYSHDAPEETMDEDEEMLDEPTEDRQLPGWLVSTHSTSGGRLYKTFTSPSGDIFRSRVTALAAAGVAQLPKAVGDGCSSGTLAGEHTASSTAADQGEDEPAQKIREALHRLSNAVEMAGLSVSAVDAWNAVRLPRKSADRRDNQHRHDIIYCSPCGRRFRSLPEALRALQMGVVRKGSSPNEGGEPEPPDNDFVASQLQPQDATAAANHHHQPQLFGPKQELSGSEQRKRAQHRLTELRQQLAAQSPAVLPPPPPLQPQPQQLQPQQQVALGGLSSRFIMQESVRAKPSDNDFVARQLQESVKAAVNSVARTSSIESAEL